MKISKILRKAAGIAGIAFPPLGAAIEVVNEFLPADKKLPVSATGAEVEQAIEALPPAERAQILDREIQLEITESNNWREIVESLAKVDETGKSTRPRIALIMAYVVAFAVLASVSAVLAAVFMQNESLLLAMSNTWPLIIAMIGTPTFLLRAYFGDRTKEKQSRYNMVQGKPAGGGAIETIIRAIRK